MIDIQETFQLVLCHFRVTTSQKLVRNTISHCKSTEVNYVLQTKRLAVK